MANWRGRELTGDEARWWSVWVETNTPNVSFEDERFDVLMDLLTPHSVALSSSENGWSARIAVEADSVDQAIARSVRIVETAARAAGLPDAPPAKTEATRWDVFERELH